MRAERRPWRWTAGVLAALTVLAGCTTTPTEPTQSPSPSATVRPFTVVTSNPLTSVDPVNIGGNTDAMVVANVFQRLMMVLPTSGELKPDLATDCLFTSELVYECTLPEGLAFSNGDALDSSDVKFSIQRALRVAAGDSSIRLLSALKRVTTPDARTVKFELSWPDNQFGFALAAPAASIVDEQVYPTDAVSELDQRPIGSGPYQVETVAADGASIVRNLAYIGPRLGGLEAIQLTVVADSVAAEAAIAQGNADVVWRSLDAAALQRLTDEIAASPTKSTATGFTRYELPGVRVTRLSWNPTSTKRAKDQLRLAVAKALQADRTLDSLVPLGVTDHASAFPLGGRPKLPELTGKRVQLTLGYDPSSPGQDDLARLLRDRLENLDSVSVRVAAGDGDLRLTDEPAWVNTATGWLQLYLANPVKDSAAPLEELERRARTTSGTERTAALTQVQQRAVVDNTVLPVSQADGILFLGKGVSVVGEAFGNGQELGWWGLRRG